MKWDDKELISKDSVVSVQNKTLDIVSVLLKHLIFQMRLKFG